MTDFVLGVRTHCRNCLFFEPSGIGSGHIGVCKRYPMAQSKPPQEWCGEWQPDPETERNTE